MKKQVRIAIAYDFDGTLAPGNMQEHSYLPSIGITKEEFWKEVKAMAKDQDMDEILAYMYKMIFIARYKDKGFTRSSFTEHGRKISFFPGVATWFQRMNSFAKENSIQLDHYIISSGLREIIEGTAIAKFLRFIFASGFAYDSNQVAVWPALAINYTTKTQYLFRINKGIINSYDNTTINRFVPVEERPIPFSNIVYLGDGESDVPCMKMLKFQGGYSVAIYDPKKGAGPRKIAADLINQERADYAAPADYSKGSELEKVIKSIMSHIAAAALLRDQRQTVLKRNVSDNLGS